MPKQLIEIDVPEGFEVDTNWDEPVGRYTFNSAMTVMFVDVAIRRKLSHEKKSHLSRNEMAFDYENARFRTDDSSFGAFATEDCSVVLKLLPHDYRETYAIDYWVLPSGARHGTNCDVSMLELRRPHFLLSKGERWPWVDCDDPIAITVRHVARRGAMAIPLHLKTAILTASAQPSPPEPVPIESDCSEQVTRLLRHLGIDVPPTAAEVDDLVRCTLNSLRAENWVDLGERLLPQIKEIHLGDGKSVRVSGEIHRDDWQWPEWLNKEWLFLTRRGVWMAGNDEPEFSDVNGDWWIKAFSGTWEAMSPDFVPPPCTDWRQSKRRNPQWKD